MRVMMDENIITVGMGEFAVAHNPHVLRIIGLGSCIGVALYAREQHCGSLAHVMLPDSTEYGTITGNPNKYADLCIKNMLSDFFRMFPAVKRSSLTAKIVGGAHMFSNLGGPPVLDIGKKNSDAVKKNLDRENIRLLDEEIGGTCGRTMEFDLSTGSILVKMRDMVKTM